MTKIAELITVKLNRQTDR